MQNIFNMKCLTISQSNWNEFNLFVIMAFLPLNSSSTEIHGSYNSNSAPPLKYINYQANRSTGTSEMIEEIYNEVGESTAIFISVFLSILYLFWLFKSMLRRVLRKEEQALDKKYTICCDIGTLPDHI